MTDQLSPLDYLLHILPSHLPSITNLSGHGSSLVIKLDQKSFCGFTCYSISPEISYPIASFYLQLLQEGDISLVKYRSYCKKFGVDPIKAIHKSAVLYWFQIKKKEELNTTNIHNEAKILGNTLKPSLKDLKFSKSKEKLMKKSIPTSNIILRGKKEKKLAKKQKASITHEEIVKNLSHVVTKRSQPIQKKLKSIVNHQNENKQHNSEELQKLIDYNDFNKGYYTKEEKDNLFSFLSTNTVFSYTQHIDQSEILSCLSSSGFELESVSQSRLEHDRRIVESIMANETPVGNSSSILQCNDPLLSSSRLFSYTTNPTVSPNKTSISHQRDFGRILHYYNTVMNSSKRSLESNKFSSKFSKFPSSESEYKYLVPRPRVPKQAYGNPIIILPNSLTSPITLINAESFFVNATYVSRETLKQSTCRAKKPTSLIITRPIPPYYGTGTIEYEVIDNPIGKLHTPQDWDRIVCVVAHGAEWQFKGWTLSSENKKKTR